MNSVIGMLQLLYSCALRVYPKKVRIEFEDEMGAVFNAVMKGASQRGVSPLIACAFREVRSVLSLLIREHRDCLVQRIQRQDWQFMVDGPDVAGKIEEGGL